MCGGSPGPKTPDLNINLENWIRGKVRKVSGSSETLQISRSTSALGKIRMEKRGVRIRKRERRKGIKDYRRLEQTGERMRKELQGNIKYETRWYANYFLKDKR
jgi:hypothetical protein